jgi:hypothetical protein
MNITEILKQAGGDILTEDTLNAISEAFNAEVDRRVNDKIELERDNIRITLNEEHGVKMQRILEHIDDSHSAAFKQAINKLNSHRKGQLKKAITHYESKIQKDRKLAVEHVQNLTRKISQYLDEYLDEKVPSDLLQEAAKNKHVEILLEKVKNVVGVDEVFSNKKIKGLIDKTKTKALHLEEENKKLKREKLIRESRNILESKTKNLPDDMTEFLVRRLAGKSPKYILENFDYVKRMYLREQRDLASRTGKKVLNENRRTSQPVDHSHRGAVDENKPVTESQNVDPQMDLYMEGLQYTSGRY